jgi:hypothetical protein
LNSRKGGKAPHPIPLFVITILQYPTFLRVSFG